MTIDLMTGSQRAGRSGREGWESIKMKHWVWGLAVILALKAGAALHDHSAGPLAVKQVPTGHKVVAFTFDDGPHPGTTPELLRVLQEKGVKGTFFVLGSNAEMHMDLLRQIVAEGHEVANHGYSHKFAKDMNLAGYLAEVDRTADVVSGVTARPVLFRPPGGSYNDRLVAALQQRGYSTVLWSVDARDWARPPADQVVKTVTEAVKPGSICLFHDGQQDLPTPQAVSRLIDILGAQGYRMVTVGELLQYYEIRP